MTYQLIALDIDGTLIDDNRAIRASTITALQEAKKRGIAIMLVTGRHHSTTYPYWHELKLSLPAICCNGAYAYDFERKIPAIDNNPIQKAEAKILAEIVKKHQIFTMIYADEAIYYENNNPPTTGISDWMRALPEEVRPALIGMNTFNAAIASTNSIWKLNSNDPKTTALQSAAKEIENALPMKCLWAGENCFDIGRTENSKGAYLARFLQTQNIDPKNVIAFGDEQNDLEMLKMVGCGVAMGNAIPALKEVADFVTAKNSEDGIAEALTHFGVI